MKQASMSNKLDPYRVLIKQRLPFSWGRSHVSPASAAHVHVGPCGSPRSRNRVYCDPSLHRDARFFRIHSDFSLSSFRVFVFGSTKYYVLVTDRSTANKKPKCPGKVGLSANREKAARVVAQ